MVMHILNCTYGGGINHEAESCCCFLGRMAEQMRRCSLSQAAARLNCQDCCQNLLSFKVDLVGVASFPCRGCQRCSADSDTCGRCFGLQTESFSIHSLQDVSPSHHTGWDSSPPGVKSLTLIFPGGLCHLLTSFGHRAGKKSKDVLEDINKESWMKPCGRTGGRSCPGSVLVHVSWGSSVLLQRQKDVGHTTSSFCRVQSSGEKSDAELQGRGGCMALRCCMLVFFHDFWCVSAGQSEEGREGERKQHTSLCPAQEGLAAGLCSVSNLNHCGRRKQNWLLLPDGSSLTRPTEHWFDFHFAAF